MSTFGIYARQYDRRSEAIKCIESEREYTEKEKEHTRNYWSQYNPHVESALAATEPKL